jgi:3',5'-cyclic AMP phosphodiesterase CpdA
MQKIKSIVSAALVLFVFLSTITNDSRAGEPPQKANKASNTQENWTFVSFPDFFNFDVPNPKPEWDQALDWYLTQIQSENPDFVMISGDMVNGHWWMTPQQLKNYPFARYSAYGGKHKFLETRVHHLARLYYGGWKRRLEDHNLKFYTAIGDHELGDDPWPKWKARLVPAFEKAFADLLGMPKNGPEGMEGQAYYFVHNNVLFITLETFELSKNQVKNTVSEKQLKWLENTLDSHQDVNHIVVQGHVPIIKGNRASSSSRLTLEDGQNSELWKLLKSYDVDLYFAGEHHMLTAAKDEGTWQVVHGSSWGRTHPPVQSRKVKGDTTFVNYLKVDVSPGSLHLTSKEIPLLLKGGSIYNINKGVGPRDIIKVPPEVKDKGGKTVGTLTIEKQGKEKQFTQVSGAYRTAIISGKVTDLNGKTINGARISAINRKQNITSNAIGTDKGHYKLILQEGAYTLKVSADGFKETKRKVKIEYNKNQTGINFRLTPER